MNVELISEQVVPTEHQHNYVFVIDAELANVGGGSAIANY